MNFSPINSQKNDTKVLKVGVKPAPPFLLLSADNRYSGISQWLWEGLAEEAGYKYEYTQATLKELLYKLENQELDICINPLTVTSRRIEQIDFTQPFFVSASAIATRRTSGIRSAFSFVKKFFSADFLKAISVLFVVIFVFGLTTWLFERQHNPEEFPGGWKGLWEGIWWSAVTMTTVGYGDKSPRSAGGRIVALVWMFTAIIIISGLTASIASSLTVNQLSGDISSLEALKQYEVGTVAGSATQSFLTGRNVAAQGFTDLETGIAALQADEIDALVYDEPILKYALQEKGETALQVLPYRFNIQYYSFGLPKGSPLSDELNPILLRLLEQNGWRAMLAEYGLSEL